MYIKKKMRRVERTKRLVTLTKLFSEQYLNSYFSHSSLNRYRTHTIFPSLKKRKKKRTNL